MTQQTKLADNQFNKKNHLTSKPVKHFIEQAPATSKTDLPHFEQEQTNVQAQAVQLGNANMQLLQRQVMARQIGSNQGNVHLMHVMQAMNTVGPANTSNVANGPTQYIMRKADDDIEAPATNTSAFAETPDFNTEDHNQIQGPPASGGPSNNLLEAEDTPELNNQTEETEKTNTLQATVAEELNLLNTTIGKNKPSNLYTAPYNFTLTNSNKLKPNPLKQIRSFPFEDRTIPTNTINQTKSKHPSSKHTPYLNNQLPQKTNNTNNPFKQFKHFISNPFIKNSNKHTKHQKPLYQAPPHPNNQTVKTQYASSNQQTASSSNSLNPLKKTTVTQLTPIIQLTYNTYHPKKNNIHKPKTQTINNPLTNNHQSTYPHLNKPSIKPSKLYSKLTQIYQTALSLLSKPINHQPTYQLTPL